MESVINADNTVIESLQAANAALQEKLDAEHQKSLFFETELAKKELELESANNINAELSKEIESLSAKAEKQPAETSFEHEGILYGFHYHKAVINGESVTAADIANSEDLQAHLVSIGSGMIYSKGND